MKIEHSKDNARTQVNAAGKTIGKVFALFLAFAMTFSAVLNGIGGQVRRMRRTLIHIV